MYARLCPHVFLFVLNILRSDCVSVDRVLQLPHPTSKTPIELSPLYISCNLDDIIVISAPIIDKSTLYYLSQPNGDTTQLNITNVSASYRNVPTEVEEIAVKYIKGDIKSIITTADRYRIFNVNFGSGCKDTTDTYAEAVKNLMPNDFLIGPVGEYDHGNWVLCAYVQTSESIWAELFQIITVKIIETILITPAHPVLNVGETLQLSFAYPVRDLESCELTAPRSTFDRLYNRSSTRFDACGYEVTNVTKADEGLWRIIGVGRIVYDATVYVKINDVL